MPVLPLYDRDGSPFDPVMVDDIRAAMMMAACGRRHRANWMVVRAVLRYRPDEIGRLLRAIYRDTQMET